MPESGKLSRVVKIDGHEFLIEKGLELPDVDQGQNNLKAVRKIAQKTGHKADKFSSHEIEGTFDLYCEVRLTRDNYERNGIYFIIEA